MTGESRMIGYISLLHTYELICRILALSVHLLLMIVIVTLFSESVGAAMPQSTGGTSDTVPLARKLSSERVRLQKCVSTLTTEIMGVPTSDREPYALAVLATVQYFQMVVERKVRARRPDEALIDFIFLKNLCNSYVARRDNAWNLPYHKRLAVDDFSGVKLKGKEFVLNEQPVMLLGPLGHRQLGEEVDWVKKFGFRIIGDDFNNYASIKAMLDPKRVDRTAFVQLGRSWKKLQSQGFFISHNPTLHYVSQNTIREFPDIVGGHRPQYPSLYGGFVPYSFESPTMRKLISGYYEALFNSTEVQSPFPLIWLMNEPTYDRLTDPGFIRKYRKYLQVKFSDIGDLNRAWRTKFKSFQDISGDVKETERDQFDLNSFRQNYLTDWVRWLHAEVKRHDERIIVSNKPMAHRLFDLNGGVDFEAEGEFLDVPGSDAYRNPSQGMYSFSWMEATALYDYQKSIAPHKPLAELELHFAEKKNVRADYTVASLWQSFLHGVRLATFWVWDTGELDKRKKAPTGMRDTVWSQPEAAWATAKTAIDLRRLAVEASNFPVTPEVYIYYSKPSLILSPRTKSEIMRVYEAMAGLGVGVGFVTDKMIRDGALKSVKWLLIPPVEHIEKSVLTGIKQYALGGGAMVIIGKAFRADEYNRSYEQDENAIHGLYVNSIPALHVPHLAKKLSELLRGKVSRPIELVRTNDEITWPVDYRCIAEAETILCYVIGLNREPMNVRMRGVRKVINWTDLLSGEQSKSDQLLIRPRDVRLVRIALAPIK